MPLNPKKVSGERATEYVKNGMVVGLGTGSTAYFAIRKLGSLVRKGLKIYGIPTSENSRLLALEEGIPLKSFSEVTHIDITIDGADEVDPEFNLTKGGGGALLREKIVAGASITEIIVIDEAKLKDRLGQFPLPVEITPFGWNITKQKIEDLGCPTQLRIKENLPFETDNGNYILDCTFGCINNPTALEINLITICGVVECGLFIGLTDHIIIGKNDGTVKELTKPSNLEPTF